ncbi:hypothetical protein [uncultured Methanobrevibacter sp.]|uniref:hypothetical protein n=1 Tax=uncultured Methanobrevibacter sp. TaxID=253161 RepID=UPI0025D24A1C|nr:hypothetical protein [uncultured Methanobrevibacter sp.]
MEIDTQYYERFVDANCTPMDKTPCFFNENAVINNFVSCDYWVLDNLSNNLKFLSSSKFFKNSVILI